MGLIFTTIYITILYITIYITTIYIRTDYNYDGLPLEKLYVQHIR